MAKKLIRGLAKIEIGPVASDGGMCPDEDLIEIGYTVRDSTSITEADPTVQDFFCEEEDDPIDSDETAGAETVAFSTSNVHPDILVEVFGGTKTAAVAGTHGGEWEPANTKPTLYRSVKITDRKGNIVRIVKTKFSGKKSFQFQKSNPSQIDITGKILVPDKANTKKYKVTFAE